MDSSDDDSLGSINSGDEFEGSDFSDSDEGEGSYEDSSEEEEIMLPPKAKKKQCESFFSSDLIFPRSH
jgi:hypothetical protein